MDGGGKSLASVCKTCQGGAGTLGLVSGAQSISQWLSSRAQWSSASTLCKYYCNSSCSSNPDPKAYPLEPCLSCNEQFKALVQKGFCSNSGQYFDVSSQGCGASATDAYVPTCSACRALQPGIIFGGGPSLLRNEDCLGLCDPQACSHIIGLSWAFH